MAEQDLTGMVEVTDELFGRALEDQSARPEVIRSPDLIGDGNDRAWSRMYDPGLFGPDRDSGFTVFAAIEVGTDGAPKSCTVVQANRFRTGSEMMPAGPRAGEVACALVMERLRFSHALSQTGKPVAATTRVRVLFQPNWQRPVMAVVAGAPQETERELRRRRFRNMAPGYVLPGDKGWPIPGIGERVSIVVPEWRGHLGPGKQLPAHARSGLVLSLDGAGQVTQCKVILSSGLDWLDQAGCASLSSVKHRTWRPAPYFPVEIIWGRDGAQFRQAREAVPPELVAEIPLDTALVAAAKRRPDADIDLVAYINPDGSFARCLIRGTSGDDQMDARACALAKARGRFTAPRGIFGDPAPGTVAIYVDWERSVLTNKPLARMHAASPSR